MRKHPKPTSPPTSSPGAVLNIYVCIHIYIYIYIYIYTHTCLSIDTLIPRGPEGTLWSLAVMPENVQAGGIYIYIYICIVE